MSAVGKQMSTPTQRRDAEVAIHTICQELVSGLDDALSKTVEGTQCSRDVKLVLVFGHDRKLSQFRCVTVL
jgi:hypothetical protein